MPTLEITTVAACTIRCTFCPQDTLKAAYPKDSAHRLSLDNFKAVLHKLPSYVRIDFSGFVEPWLNPDCTEMLRSAFNMGFSVGIYTTLQGMKDPERVAELLTGNTDMVEVLCLHMPDINGNMTGFQKTDEWIAAHVAFQRLEKSGALKRFERMTMDGHGTVDYRRDEGLLVPGKLLPWVGNDRAGTLDRTAVRGASVEPQVDYPEAIGCSFTPFYDQNVMLPNGDVVLCCMDYGLRHKLGNLFTQRYDELFSGQAMAELHAANMRRYGPEANEDPPKRTICRSCTRATRYSLPRHARQMWVEEKP